MANQALNNDIMEYMVWIIEIVSVEFFDGDKTLAYEALQQSGVWHMYVSHYDVTHSLGSEYILQEIKEVFIEKGVAIS